MAGWSPEPGLDDPVSSPLRALVAGFPGAAAHVSGDIIWLNRFAEEIVGYRAAELPSVQAWGEAVHGENEPEARRVYLAAREAGFTRPEELIVTRKDGSRRLIQFSAYLGDGEEVWVMNDITDARRAAAELREREQRLEVAVTTAGLGIWEWDGATGRITADAATRRMFDLGDTGGDDDYDDYLARVSPEDRSRFADAIGTAVEERSRLDVELRTEAGGGRSRWLRLHGAAVDDDGIDRVRIIGAVRDIDSDKRLDERLIHAARMESLGQLAGGVAHDFNNLLAVIGGHTEFVAKDPAITDRTAARLHTIERAVTKGAEMVAKLLQLGHSSAARATVVDLDELLRANLDSVTQLVGEDVTVSLQLDAAEPHVTFDESRLSAVVLNLATNARDAMPMGGLLTISTRNVSLSDDEPAWVQLRVEDTGIGMDRAVRARIFEPFYTTKAPGVGNGLGLASVYDAVIDAGGKIDVESTPGVGSAFTISLPARPAPADAAAAVPPEAAQGPTGQTVMIVEDDPTVLELTADILRSAGYRVVEALGPQQALDLIASGETPDALLTDVVMPELSGPRLAARLTERFPGLRVLYMSGYTSAGRGEVPMDDARLIRKPFGHRHLIERVARLLAEPAAD